MRPTDPDGCLEAEFRHVQPGRDKMRIENLTLINNVLRYAMLSTSTERVVKNILNGNHGMTCVGQPMDNLLATQRLRSDGEVDWSGLNPNLESVCSACKSTNLQLHYIPL